MRVIIVGAGVMGITTAYFLQQQGCEVYIIDRTPEPAMECSAANGGFYSAGLSAPWSAPGAAGMAFKSQFDSSAAFKWRPDFTWRQIAWTMKSFKECRIDRFAVNRVRLTRMAQYALECLKSIESDIATLDYRPSTNGVLQVYRQPVPEAMVNGHLRHLEAMGIAARFLTRTQMCELEPALARSTPELFGGLHMRDDLSGDCAVFTRNLAAAVAARGGTFIWNTPVKRLRVEDSRGSHGKVSALVSQYGEFEADAYVFATGAETPLLLKGIVDVPVYPIKGYSMTASIVSEDNAPRHSLFDFASKMGMARLGNEMRISGIAEVVGYDSKLSHARCNQLAAAFEKAFPDAVDNRNATYWTGLRPATPDGVPRVGRTPCENLFINTGHGGSGWSMSCGSGKLIADIVTGKPADINADDYALIG